MAGRNPLAPSWCFLPVPSEQEDLEANAHTCGLPWWRWWQLSAVVWITALVALIAEALELSSRIGSSSSAPQTLELSDLLYYACLLPLTFPMLCACKVAIWIGLKSYRCN